MSWDCRVHRWSSDRLVQLGLVDPVRLFIKNEPHKKSKLLSGFLRLISNVSLLDELIDRLLFSSQDEIEIDSWFNIPSKPGMGFTDEMMAITSKTVYSRAAKHLVAEGDSSSWDWTVQGWELMVEAELRIILLGINPEGILARVMRNRIYCVSLSVFVLSNGEMYAQNFPGIMLSGWKCTSSSNSRIGRLDALLSGADWSIHNGDDFLADYVPEFKERFENLGHILKLYEPIGDTFEFCSTVFPTFEPCNKWKMFVKLLSNGTKKYWERLGLFWDWQHDMRHHPERDSLTELIVASGFLFEDPDTSYPLSAEQILS